MCDNNIYLCRWNRPYLLLFPSREEYNRFVRKDFDEMPDNVLFGIADPETVEAQYGGTAKEALLLAHRAEDEVGILFGDILQLCLRSIKEALTHQTTRANGYLRLIHVIARPARIVLQAQRHLDAHLLMGLQDLIEHIVYRKEKSQ